MTRHKRHPRPSQRLSRRQERWLYGTAGVLLASGLGWLISHYLLVVHGPFGDAPHPSEIWWLRLHGAAMIGFLVAFGALLPGHAVRNWRGGFNRGSGLAVVIVAAVLAVSGYGLYYIVGDEWRARVSLIHWVVGLAAAVALGVHVVLGKRAAAAAPRMAGTGA